jgi:hypothetical protein
MLNHFRFNVVLLILQYTSESSIAIATQVRRSRELQLWPCSIAIRRTARAREQGLTCTIAAELLASGAASDDSIDGRTTSFTGRNHPPGRSDRLPERPGAHHHRERHAYFARAFAAHHLIAPPQTPTTEIRHQLMQKTNTTPQTKSIGIYAYRAPIEPN